jgi:hypothetical protein
MTDSSERADFRKLNRSARTDRVDQFRWKDGELKVAPKANNKAYLKPDFQVALVDKITPTEREKKPKWNDAMKAAVADKLVHWLLELAPGGKKYFPVVGWDFKASEIREQDAVIYFVGAPGSTVTKAAGAGFMTVPGHAGLASPGPNGLVAEVYQWTLYEFMSGHRVAMYAFHELMHGVLDIGRDGQSGVPADIHALTPAPVATNLATDTSKTGVSYSSTDYLVELRKPEKDALDRWVTKRGVRFWTGGMPA